MATKDISDQQVCEAYRDYDADRSGPWPYELLVLWSGEPWKVCYRACERAARRGLVDYGVSLRSGWLTEKGQEVLRCHTT